MGLNVLFRLLRIQFLPVMIAPVVLGGSFAWGLDRRFDFFLFTLALIGSIFLHLAANAIDDVYDFLNGVDSISDRLFPKDSPSWKPIPRGYIRVSVGIAISYLFYAVSFSIGIYLSLLVGWLAIAIAVPGILLSYFYTAPPLKLDYRGIGLGELSILLCFGPIPALGTYYVLTSHLSSLVFLASIPTGMLTTNVLISHDMIFYEPYKEAGKRSIVIVLGRGKALKLYSAIALLSYILIALYIIMGYLPLKSLIVLICTPLLVKLIDFTGKEREIKEYGSRTILSFLHSVAFTSLLAISQLIL